MNKADLLILFLMTVFALSTGGCRRPGRALTDGNNPVVAAKNASLRAVSTAAVKAVAEPMRPFFAAGLGFIICGGVGVVLGARRLAAILLALGAVVTGVGVLFVQYPWTVLVLALPGAGVAIFAVIDAMRIRRRLLLNQEALTATAEVIQNLPEGEGIKKGLRALGAETEARIREVITPIKERLRQEGKIGS